MNKINVLGLGPGNPTYILPIVRELVDESDVLIGGRRNIESIEGSVKGKEIKYIDRKLSELIDYIKANRDKKISIIVSGDPGFYSMLNYLKKHFSNEELNVIPGISSMQYMFSRISTFWYDAYISSLHGKEFDFVEIVKSYDKVGLLTDNKYTPQYIAKELNDNNIKNVKIYVGENLSYDNEKISVFNVEELSEYKHIFGINVVIIEKVNN